MRGNIRKTDPDALNWERAILAAPKEERLDAAFAMIRDLLGGSSQDVTAWRQALGLTERYATILTRLCSRPGNAIPKHSLTLGEFNDDHLKVWVCNLRHMLWRMGHSGAAIETVKGIGYSIRPDVAAALRAEVSSFISQRLNTSVVDGVDECELVPASRQGTPWLFEEDQRLVDGVTQKKTKTEIALELGRSERAVRDRLSHLTQKARKLS